MSDNERRDHLSAWRVSGLSGSAYCKSAGLKYSTFMRWASVLGERTADVGQFVALSGMPVSAEELRIMLPNGVSIITRQSLNLELLKYLADV